MPLDPFFISRSQLEMAHRISLERYGGTAGVRSEELLESALAAPINDFLYLGADLFGIAAAYAFQHRAGARFLDGNKRAAVEAAFVFLTGNGVPTDTADSYPLYRDLIAIAERRMTKAELADRFRQLFGR